MSMQRKREAVIASGLAFAESTNPRDELFTVHFNERVWFGLPQGQRFTSKRDELRTALQKSTARGRSAVFDAIANALQHVERGTSQKKALIVISDGGDNSSRRALADVVSAAQRSEAIIYTVCLTDEYDRDADPEALEQLSRVSGGIPFKPRKVAEVADILRRIARDLHSGYTIGYVPSRPDASAYRAVRVDVTSEKNRTLLVRARAGYATD
jgi:Ca-activated chloride channel homolog